QTLRGRAGVRRFRPCRERDGRRPSYPAPAGEGAGPRSAGSDHPHLETSGAPAMKRTFVCLLVSVAVVSARPRAGGAPPAKSAHPWMAQFMIFAFPEELASARKTDRIAWVANDKGLRNVFTAAAPLFKPVRVTAFLKDNGIESTQLSISNDGSTVTFTRGGA